MDPYEGLRPVTSPKSSKNIQLTDNHTNSHSPKGSKSKIDSNFSKKISEASSPKKVIK